MVAQWHYFCPEVTLLCHHWHQSALILPFFSYHPAEQQWNGRGGVLTEAGDLNTKHTSPTNWQNNPKCSQSGKFLYPLVFSTWGQTYVVPLLLLCLLMWHSAHRVPTQEVSLVGFPLVSCLIELCQHYHYTKICIRFSEFPAFLKKKKYVSSPFCCRYVFSIYLRKERGWLTFLKIKKNPWEFKEPDSFLV